MSYTSITKALASGFSQFFIQDALDIAIITVLIYKMDVSCLISLSFLIDQISSICFSLCREYPKRLITIELIRRLSYTGNQLRTITIAINQL